ncbi:MAG: hypothetical protein ACRDIF_02365 [Actinomycetota bacterium]
MAIRRNLLFALLALALAACAPPAGRGPEVPSLPGGTTREVAGFITEIEDHNLSLRASDGRQLIFTFDDPPVTLEYLQARMAGVRPISVTYILRNNRLVPIEITDACPEEDPDCLPPPAA